MIKYKRKTEVFMKLVSGKDLRKMKNSRKFLTKSRVTSLLTAVIFMLCNALIPTFAAGEVLTQKNGGTLVRILYSHAIRNRAWRR